MDWQVSLKNRNIQIIAGVFHPCYCFKIDVSSVILLLILLITVIYGVSCYCSLPVSDINRERKVWELRLWRLVPSPLAVSSVYFRSTKPWGQGEGLPEKWGVKCGCGRIPPTPQWICEWAYVPAHASALWLFCRRSHWGVKGQILHFTFREHFK